MKHNLSQWFIEMLIHLNSKTKKQNRQRTETATSPKKKTHRWPKGTQHHQPWEKCTSKSQWSTLSHLSEEPPSKTKQNKTKNSNQQMLARIWRKGNLHALPVGKQTEAASTENSIEAPQKITNGTTVWSSNSTSGHLARENENTISKRYMYPQWTQQHHLQ